MFLKETLKGKRYLSLHTRQVPKEILHDSDSKLSEISDYEINYSHDNSDTDDIYAAVHVFWTQDIT